MTQTKNTGMSIIGFLQDAPPTARICIVDKGQSSDAIREAMRHPQGIVMVGELRDPTTAETIQPAINAQESCVSTTIHKRPAQENPHA
ncbi:ATPase, T2SS/T4P/T4SS family [Acidithiobacillus ferriphilus]|uniref:ATPase, T2SS/T4P/T4SS family n=1 Tax=Acidithiobacillus ferriphilus TaxID=1689834 RepID=UPI001C07511E|nr:ATPase, T2SS/T4P/T4SS family [Acidithiobacillus ferriphilus]MBU2853350.1 Flp pilus assembly complex ATPase component TadA [Acidithiobacillus ferriphilus]